MRRLDYMQQGWPRALYQIKETIVRAGWVWRVGALWSLVIILLLGGCDSATRGGAEQGARGQKAVLAVAFVLTGARLDAYNAATGKRLWRFTPTQPASSLPSMAVSGDVVYLSDGDLYALKARDGHQLWHAPIGGGDFVSPLSVAGGVAYVESSGVVYAVNARDGFLRWRQQVGAGLNALLVTGDTLYVGLGVGGGITALRASDGSTLWQTDVGGGGADSIYALQLTAGTLYASTTDNHLLVLNPADGQIRWSYQNSTIQVLSQPTVVGATIYLVAQSTTPTTSSTGSIGVRTLETMVALRPKDGTTLWQKQLPIGLPASAVISALDPVGSSDGSTVYVVAGPTAGDVVALAATDGTIHWQIPSGDTLLALLGADNRTLYTGAVSGVVGALSADSGTPRWRTPVGQSGQAAPVLRLSLEHGTLYAATADGTCTALDPKTGRVRWYAPAGSSSPAEAGLTPPMIVAADITA